MVLTLAHNTGALSIRVSTKNLPALLSQIKNKWQSISPNVQMNYSFMDEDFNAVYHTEQRVGNIFVIFTSLAIIIACLGLFGLAAYAAEQRTKEIGIRKVLGASIAGITAMLSLDFIKLVLIAILIALPAGWLLMNQWLREFAYRVNVNWWIMALAAFIALFIALLTIGYQSIKAALSNPVNSLRSE